MGPRASIEHIFPYTVGFLFVVPGKVFHFPHLDQHVCMLTIANYLFIQHTNDANGFSSYLVILNLGKSKI